MENRGPFSRFSTDHFDFQYKEDTGAGNTYFFNIRKKHHGAVERNYLKRRIREFFRTHQPGRAYLIKAGLRKPMDLSDKKILLQELETFASRLS